MEVLQEGAEAARRRHCGGAGGVLLRAGASNLYQVLKIVGCMIGGVRALAGAVVM